MLWASMPETASYLNCHLRGAEQYVHRPALFRNRPSTYSVSKTKRVEGSTQP
jgi:hypothetical protein